MEAWLRYYNEERPHGAIGYKAPGDPRMGLASRCGRFHVWMLAKPPNAELHNNAFGMSKASSTPIT